MRNWHKHLRFDPIPHLIHAGIPALVYWARRDLLGERSEPVESLWTLPEAAKIVRHQQPDGSWKYPAKHPDPTHKYAQIATYTNLRELVEKYGFHRGHPAIVRAAEYILSCQTVEGDIRGIYGTQYSPNYTAGLIELFIKAGYGDDARIAKALTWLLSTRQEDGGWAIAFRTRRIAWREAEKRAETIQPDRSKPFSHLVTGVVLRAFAAHPVWRRSAEARRAGELLALRFFRPDVYVDRGGPEFWEHMTFPFWFTDLVSALDSLSYLGFTRRAFSIARALEWLQSKQRQDGSFRLKTLRGGKKDPEVACWQDLAVCRLFRRYDGDSRP